MNRQGVKMRKIVINTLYGSGMFGVSRKALHRLRELKNKYALEDTDFGEQWPGTDKIREKRPEENFWLDNIPRDDPQLVQVVEELGSEADGEYSELKIVVIPADVEWEIGSDDNSEWVYEKHRRWD